MTRTKDLLALYMDGLEIVESNTGTPVLYAPRNASDPAPWARISYDNGVLSDSGFRYQSREVHCPDVGGGPVAPAHKKVAADVARLRTYGWRVQVYTTKMTSATYVQVSATRYWFEEHILWGYTTRSNSRGKVVGTRFTGAVVHYAGGGEKRHANRRGLEFHVLDVRYGIGTRYCGDDKTAGDLRRWLADREQEEVNA